MSRLIDGEKLYKELCEFITTQCDDMGTGLLALDLVNSQPTAYDVEAVVRELEEEITRTKEKERQCFIDNNVKMGFCLNGRAAAMNFAIEIVKRGGRNERTD